MLLLSLAAYAQDGSPTGSIRSVVVYPDRAAVTRVLPVELKAGINAVTFTNLPPTLQEQTLQAGGSGPEGTRVLGLDVVSRELAEDRRARVAELQEQIVAVEDDIRAQGDIVASAKTEKAFLEGLQSATAGQLSAELLFASDTVTKAQSMADLLRGRVPGVWQTIRTAQIETRTLKDQVNALRRELSTVQGAAQWSRRDVTIQVGADAAGKGEVTVTYMLPGASWRPYWDVRATSDSSDVSLSLSAMVTQTTGEDWSDVALSLSTAAPARGVDPPALDAFWIDVYRPPPPPPPAYYDDWDGDEELAEEEEEDMGFADEMDVERSKSKKEKKPAATEPMRVSGGSVTERAVASSFDVTEPATVPGEGTRRKILATEVKLGVDRVHVIVPRKEEAAFLIGRGEWKEQWPMLAGDAGIFVDGAFVGTAFLPRVGTGSEVELGFGRDDAVSIERTVEVDETGRPNLWGKITRELAWSMVVSNGRSEPVTVELVDRIPRSRHARFKVKPRPDVTEPTETDSDGIVTFVSPVQPGAPWTVQHGYRIKYPKKRPPGVLE